MLLISPNLTDDLQKVFMKRLIEYLVFIVLVSCNSENSRNTEKTSNKLSDSIVFRFIDGDNLKVLKDFNCKILLYNEIYPNEEDLRQGITLYPDSFGCVNVSKVKLDKLFSPKFQVCFSDENTIGYHRYYCNFNVVDTTFVVNYFSQFNVVYNPDSEISNGDVLKLDITKTCNGQIVDQVFQTYDYLKHQLSGLSTPVYFRKNESIKVEAVITNNGIPVKKHVQFLTYKKATKYVLDANTGILSSDTILTKSF